MYVGVASPPHKTKRSCRGCSTGTSAQHHSAAVPLAHGVEAKRGRRRRGCARLADGQGDAAQHGHVRARGVGEMHVLKLKGFDLAEDLALILLSSAMPGQPGTEDLAEACWETGVVPLD